MWTWRASRAPVAIRHIWITLHSLEEHYLRRCVLRAWWDGEERPSIEVPVADFFSVGHAAIANSWSLPMNTNTGGDSIERHRMGMNCFFPMPFGQGRATGRGEPGRQAVARALLVHRLRTVRRRSPTTPCASTPSGNARIRSHAAYDIARPPSGSPS